MPLKNPSARQKYNRLDQVMARGSLRVGSTGDYQSFSYPYGGEEVAVSDAAECLSNFNHTIAGGQHIAQRRQYSRKRLQQFHLTAIAEPDPDHLRRDAALPIGERLKTLVLGDDGQTTLLGVLPNCSVFGCL